ncbi:hypothetical protein DW133_04670 [Sutterella sp. AM11-39]|nr:hypothetical protein DW133_04670 [Sutterella sp. AM11-39]
MAVSQQPAATTKKTIRRRGSRAGENGQEKNYRSSKKVDIVFLSLSDVNLFRIACLKSSATKPSFKF